ncbi:MAG: C-type lectin domain-containing protein [Chloroflexi bacterium CFX1]|nr:C-type lectin domain-containing protein [Chloroflexi bacterium CFX1]MCQ3953202.1 hypothetical protein [Chloroflexota bacterium]MDL1920053.1 C-type lectin domain-containing protein [Chloroflexi bacterium CFX5]
MKRLSFPRKHLIIGGVILIALLAFGWYLASLDGRIAIVASGATAQTNTTTLSAISLSTIDAPTSTSMPTATIITYTQTPYKGVKNPDNGHWYLVFSQSSWDHAINYCTSRGGHLVTIDNAEENLFVYNLAPYVLLGATDKEREGRWRWATGQEMIYTNWCQGEPNNCGNLEVLGYCEPENYLTFAVPQCLAGQWNDIPTDDGGGTYVCEFED